MGGVRVFMIESCKSCGGAVEIESEGAAGVAGYRTHNEYFCPHCRKQNHALTSGAIVSARASQPDTATGRM
jgi:RecJ-like exonuclease